MVNSSAAPGISSNQVNLSTLTATIQNSVQAQNLIATRLSAIDAALIANTAVLQTAFPAPLSGSAAWTPGLIGAAGSVSTTVTVAGATLAMFVKAAYNSSLGGLTLSAYVSSANTITVVLANNTAGSITPSAGIVTVSVTTS